MSVEGRSVEETLSFVDWDRIRSVMRFLNWTWADEEDVPSVTDLWNRSKQLLNSLDLLQNKLGASTGGLSAYIYLDEELGEIYGLAFDVCRYREDLVLYENTEDDEVN